MSGTRLYPFPRFDRDVEWSPISATVEGRPTGLHELADQWDAASTITFEVTAALPVDLHLALEESNPRLVITGGCKNTGVSASSESAFIVGSTRSSATAAISFPGGVLAERMDVRASVIVSHTDIPWLARRVIAERGSEKISLDSSLTGFPTISISFEENKMMPAPWHLRVSAVSLMDPFAHSIQLVLNEDYPRVVALIEGRAEPYVESALHRSILRTLLQSASRLASEEGEFFSLKTIAAEHPESIGAAAAKACSDYLQRDLSSVITVLRRRPEDVEMWIAGATNAMKEKRR